MHQVVSFGNKIKFKKIKNAKLKTAIKSWIIHNLTKKCTLTLKITRNFKRRDHHR